MSREIQDLLQRLRKLEDNRRQWDDHFQELGELFLPRRADFTATHQPGQRRQERQFDGVPMQAARGLASSIDGLLKPKSERWFTLTTADDDFDDLDEVKLWFEFVQDRMWQAIYDPLARFVQRSNEVDLDLTVFGTGVLFVGERMRINAPVLDFRSYHLRNTFIAENADGEIDTVFRRLTLTARQAAQKFPEERLGRRTRELLRSSRDREKEVRFVHAVLPRKERDGKGPPNRNMPFASLWIDVDGEHLIAEGGFNEMPYIVPRFDTGTDEVYGRSPAMVALPDANTLMEQGKTILKAGHKIVDPPLLSPNEGVASRPRTFPGGITYYDAEILSRTGGRQPIFPLLTGANIPIGRDMQSDSREAVWNAFFRNLLQLPTEGPQMTATEILERRSEFVRLIGPTFGRLEADYTAPLLERVFSVLLRAGEFGPPETVPEVLRGAEIKFRLVAPVVRAMRQLEATALRKTIDDLAPVVQADPAMLDHFDTDRIARDVSDANGVPTKWLRPLETVDAIRGQRAQAQASQAEATAAQATGQLLNQGAANLAQLAGNGDPAIDVPPELTGIL